MSIVWFSKNDDKYQKLVWITVFLTFDLIIFGAFTRLADAGLGCPDWPGCYGQASPWHAQEHIRAAESNLPTGPVTWIKAWIEMIHRYFAMGIGGLVTLLMLWAWRRWYQEKSSSQSPILPTLLFGFICFQGALGAWTVTTKLQPLIVTMHLLLGMVLLAMLTWLGCSTTSTTSTVLTKKKNTKHLIPAVLIFCLLFIQIALGGWVSTNYAVLACSDFPLCQGQWIPPMDFANGFSPWRKLGKTAAGEYLPFPAFTAIHWVHRNIAFIVFACLGWLALKTRHLPPQLGLRGVSQGLFIAIVVQFFTGLATILLAWPLVIAVGHSAGAACMVLLMTKLVYKLYTQHQGQVNSH